MSKGRGSRDRHALKMLRRPEAIASAHKREAALFAWWRRKEKRRRSREIRRAAALKAWARRRACAPVKPEIRPRLEPIETSGPVRILVRAGRSVAGQWPTTTTVLQAKPVPYGVDVRVGWAVRMRVRSKRTISKIALDKHKPTSA